MPSKDSLDNIVHIETLGCRLNQDESEGIAHFFSEAGFSLDMENVSLKHHADSEKVFLCIVNTCTVTGKAEQKARRVIRLLLQTFTKAFVIVTGCYAESGAEEILALSKSRIVVLNGKQKSLLKKLAFSLAKDAKNACLKDLNTLKIENYLFAENESSVFFPIEKKKNSALFVETKKLAVAENPFELYTSQFVKHSRASLKIQDGCNNNCSFCKIHIARGKAISLNVEEVLNRVKELENANIPEVVLTGVNLSQYLGKRNSDSRENANFTELLKILLNETSKIRFRISSFYPEHITKELCEVIASERVQNSFHLSVQSGNDEILRLMLRPYSAQDVRNAVLLLRSAKKNPFISCDIIAGFPSESEDAFLDTKNLCGELHFAWIHAFPFSPRQGTLAGKMQNQIAENIKNDRVKVLTNLAIEEKRAYIASFVGKRLFAVVENSRQMRLLEARKENVFHAVTENFLHVFFESEKEISAGQMVQVELESVTFLGLSKENDRDAKAKLVCCI